MAAVQTHYVNQTDVCWAFCVRNLTVRFFLGAAVQRTEFFPDHLYPVMFRPQQTSRITRN